MFFITIKIFILNCVEVLAKELAHTHLSKHKARAILFRENLIKHLVCLLFSSFQLSVHSQCIEYYFLFFFFLVRHHIDLSPYFAPFVQRYTGPFIVILFKVLLKKSFPFNCNNAEYEYKLRRVLNNHQTYTEFCTTGYCFVNNFFFCHGDIFLKHAFIIVVNLQHTTVLGPHRNEINISSLYSKSIVLFFCSVTPAFMRNSLFTANNKYGTIKIGGECHLIKS